MAFLLLFGAIASEVLGTSLLKATEGFSRLWPTVICLAGYVVSFVLLAQAVKSLPVGFVYAVWSGLGTVAIVGIGIVFLNEAVSVYKIVGVVLVISGVVLLNVGGAH